MAQTFSPFFHHVFTVVPVVSLKRCGLAGGLPRGGAGRAVPGAGEGAADLCTGGSSDLNRWENLWIYDLLMANRC